MKTLLWIAGAVVLLLLLKSFWNRKAQAAVPAADAAGAAAPEWPMSTPTAPVPAPPATTTAGIPAAPPSLMIMETPKKVPMIPFHGRH